MPKRVKSDFSKPLFSVFKQIILKFKLQKMKKITIFAGILFFFSIANGQVNKGAILIGGQVSSVDFKSSDSSSKSNNPYSNVSISLAKSFDLNSLYGVSLGYAPYSTTREMNNGSSTYISRSYSASIFYRKYQKLLNTLYLFNETGIQFNYVQTKYSYNTINLFGEAPYTGNGYTGSLNYSPGIAYRIFKRMDLELTLPNLASLSYSTSKNLGSNVGSVGNSKNSSFTFNTNLSFSQLAFGLKIIL